MNHSRSVSAPSLTCPRLSLKAWRSWGHSVWRMCPSPSPTSGPELHSLHPPVSPLQSLSLFHSQQSESVQAGDTRKHFKNFLGNWYDKRSFQTTSCADAPLPRTGALQSSHSGCLPWCCSILRESTMLLYRFWKGTVEMEMIALICNQSMKGRNKN